MPALVLLTPLCSRLVMVAAFVLGGSCEDEALADEPKFRASAYCEAQYQECVEFCPDDPIQWEACEQGCYSKLFDCESYASDPGGGGQASDFDSGCGPELADAASDCSLSLCEGVGSSIGDSEPDEPDESDDWGEDWGERERGGTEPLAAPVDLPSD